LEIEASPTVAWDGPFKKDQGSEYNVEIDMIAFNTSIISAGNRNVKDIDLTLDVEWLGAVNIDPYDGETLVPIEQHMTWTNSEMEIDVGVTSNEASQYNGHLHVYVTEVDSTMWDDKWGDPYTFAFLDYAWNKDVTISSGGGTWDDTVIWDGYDHHTGYDEYYQNITQDNIMVIASVFDEDNNDYADETTGVRTGIDTDPKFFNLYFGNTTSPPLVAENTTNFEWFPHDGLNFSETYYWHIDIWDNNDDFFPGDEWSFTTRGNVPPEDPKWESPINQSVEVPILVNLTWTCNDPDGDDVTYDVYFGDHPEFNMNQVAWNQTENWFVVDDLDFTKKYYWYIVAWEEYGLNTTGDIWHFTTEANVPPNKAVEPHPFDGAPAVPQENVVLEWNGSDDNIGDTLRYDVYWDDVNPPLTQRVFESYDDYWEIPFTMPKYKTYWWRVDTYDKMDEFTEGKVWTFSTGDNNPPTNPFIDGKKTGRPNEDHEFTFVSTDPDNHSIWYRVQWGDGSSEDTGLYPNGTVVTLSHSWEDEGTVTIRARAYDEQDLPSDDWSEYPFTVPRDKAFNLNLLELLFTRFPKAFLFDFLKGE
jgi:hypothetical protein